MIKLVACGLTKLWYFKGEMRLLQYRVLKCNVELFLDKNGLAGGLFFHILQMNISKLTAVLFGTFRK